MGIKYKVNEEFFNKWTPEMAYVLGYWYADGSMYISERGSYLNVTSTDKDTVYKIKSLLRSEHFIREEHSDWSNRKPRFVLRIGNKTLYRSLLTLGLFPNKSLTVKFPDVPQRFLSDFVRGYFDGDGCVNLYRTKGKTQPLILRKLSVIFTSGSSKFLEGLLLNLRKHLKLKQTRVYDSHRSFQLRFATKDSIEMFRFMYYSDNNLKLDRKWEIFNEYLRLKNGAVAK